MQGYLVFSDKVNYAIEHYLKTGNNVLLYTLLPELKSFWKELAEDEQDFRGGNETYRYGNVKYTMKYISDRWRCAFRVKWLIDGLENGKI